jgi:hypothetical protein
MRQVVLLWLSSCLALQILAEIMSAGHDSRGTLSIVWWVGQLFSLPVIAATRILRGLGIEAAHFTGSIIVTLAIAFGAWLLTEPGLHRGSSTRL